MWSRNNARFGDKLTALRSVNMCKMRDIKYCSIALISAVESHLCNSHDVALR